MPASLRQFEALTEPVTSPSGEWALRYDADGYAAILDRDGNASWKAGAAGTLRLELDGVVSVHVGNEVVWRGDYPEVGYSTLRVGDDGDGVLHDSGLPVFSLLHGPIEPVSLGDRAPVADIRGNRILESSNGNRTVNRTSDGDALVCKTKLGLGAASIWVVQPEEALTLEQPDTWLTWRFLEEDGHGRWMLVLVDRDDEVRWVQDKGHAEALDPEQAAESPALPEDDDAAEEDDSRQPWMSEGLMDMEAYCVTVIHDVSPDEALRRFGAKSDQVSTSTWAELLHRASYEEAFDHDVVAAFQLGPHTLLVENNGYEGVNRPDLSGGTFAVSTYCSVNADQSFLVSRDGEILAAFSDNYASGAEGSDIDVLVEPLSAMGIDDLEAFDEDDDNFLDDLELLCQVAGVRPAVGDVTGSARVAILPSRLSDLHARMRS